MFYHIRDLRRIRDTLDFTTASTIATSLVHSKLDYCNSLYFSLPAYQIDRMQLIQNCLARAVCRTSKFSHITPTLRSLHWLKVRERIEYKILSLTYNALQYHQPSYLTECLTIQPSTYVLQHSFIHSGYSQTPALLLSGLQLLIVLSPTWHLISIIPFHLL